MTFKRVVLIQLTLLINSFKSFILLVNHFRLNIFFVVIDIIYIIL